MYDPQVYGLLGAVLLLHLGTLAYVYLRRSRSVERAGDTDAAADAADVTADRRVDTGPSGSEEGPIVCSQCGARNEPNYRFCRICVADLPGRATSVDPAGFSNAA
jgi:ribosomal protein L40E